MQAAVRAVRVQRETEEHPAPSKARSSLHKTAAAILGFRGRTLSSLYLLRPRAHHAKEEGILQSKGEGENVGQGTRSKGALGVPGLGLNHEPAPEASSGPGSQAGPRDRRPRISRRGPVSPKVVRCGAGSYWEGERGSRFSNSEKKC